MNKPPLVTVVMAVYNGEKYVRLTIESILNQTFTDFEFVIINDASTDATGEIIKSYRDSRIILYNNKTNIGQTKSLNIGLKVARGKYIARIDAGDISLPGRLKKQVSYFERDHRIAVLGTSAFQYDTTGKVISIVHMPVSVPAILRKIVFTVPVIHVSVLMRRKTILSVGGYNEDYHILADYELWSRLLMNSYILGNLRSVLSGYLVSPESFGTRNAKGRALTEACNIIRNNIYTLTNLPITEKQAANIRIFFDFDMQGMSLSEIIDTENLFINILRKMRTPKNEIQYLLIKKYIKYVFRHVRKTENNLIFWFAMRSIVHKIGSLFPKIFGEIARFYQKIFWKVRIRLLRSKFITTILPREAAAFREWSLLKKYGRC